MTGVSVREATLDDVPAVQRIAHEGWRAAYGDFLTAGVLERVREEWHTADGFRESVSNEEVAFFVAVAGQRDEPTDGNADSGDDERARVVGYASGGVRDSMDVGFVATLYVDPDYWREGIGRALFERLLCKLDDWGAARVEIHVLAENELGIAFYESRGFDRVRKGEADLPGAEEPYDEYVYARSI